MLFADYLKIEQTKALFSPLKLVMIGTGAVSFLTIVVLWPAFSQTKLLIWLTVALAIIFLRWLNSRKFDPETIDASNYATWLNRFTFFSFITGLNWGFISVFFYNPNEPVYVLFITCVYSGYMAIALSTLALHFPAFLAFSIPSTALFAIQNLIQGQSIYTAIGLMVVFYSVVLFLFGRNIGALFYKNCQLNFDKLTLLEQLVEQKETAERAVNAKSKFLAAASHDLRQPLHALSLFTDVLEPHVNSAEGKEIIKKITQSRQAIVQLLHGLLDISRLDANVVENLPKNLQLAALLSNLKEEYTITATEKNLVLELNCAPNTVVFADPILLERVIRNLLENAIKYTPEGKVSIACKDHGDEVHLSISDTGIGIPQEQQEAVFAEFTQLNNPERDRQKGLGLGLSIVQRISQLMGVKLHLESAEGSGTTITLNLTKGVANHTEQTREQKNLSLKNLHVLVVDDEKDILQGMELLLNDWGCKVTSAVSGKKALKALYKGGQEPDLIIADLRLRNNESGIDVIERVRDEYNEDIRALLVTGDTAPERLQLSYTASASVVHKPVQPKQLNKEIQKLLSKPAN